MCMQRVDKKTKVVTEGWKAFDKYHKRNSAGEPIGLQALYKSYDFRPGWNVDQSDRQIAANDGRWYPSGFHVFVHRRPTMMLARNFHKVRVGRIVASGQNQGRTVIAKRIFIRKACVAGTCDCRRRPK